MSFLTEEERVRLLDGKHNIQAATNELAGVDRSKIPNIDAIEDCLEKAGHCIAEALRIPPQPGGGN